METTIDAVETELTITDPKPDEEALPAVSVKAHALPAIQAPPITTTASPANPPKKDVSIAPPDLTIATNLDLMALTKSIPRDYAGMTDMSVKEEARRAYEKVRLDKETLTTVNAYIKHVEECVTLQQLAEAPLQLAVYNESKTSQLVPTFNMGTSTNMCLGNASGTGYVFVPYLSAVQWVLLGAVRRKFGINTAIGVRSISTYNIFSSYCYIDVVIHNTSVKYTMVDGATPLAVGSQGQKEK